MKTLARTFALCLVLIVTGWALVFSQVGADKRPLKTSTSKTPTKRATTRTTSSSTPRSEPRQTGLPIEMALIPAGTFLMGALSSEQEYSDDERPQHRVVAAVLR